jgi:hypothetical protein
MAPGDARRDESGKSFVKESDLGAGVLTLVGDPCFPDVYNIQL